MYSSIALLLGHMVGDYWFQSEKMAINKSKKGREGRFYCNIHCYIYSICVAVFVYLGGWDCAFLRDDLNRWGIWAGNLSIAFLIAYITHYPIDRISFASRWMKWFGSTDFEKAPPKTDKFDGSINIRSFFVAPVYIVVDNSMHLVLMWMLFSLLGK
jgi:hypothetical protein